MLERMRGAGQVATRTDSDSHPSGGFEDQGPPMPERFGRFRVVGRLGAGAMGIVFSAHDPLLDRDVAVKLMQPHRVSPMALARASREAQAMARLSHPNVVQVYGMGRHGDALYVAMEYVDGDTLGSWQESARDDPASILAAYRQAGMGLGALHEHGLVHRDFKPANAMRGHDGRVRVLDLGLVRETSNPVYPDVLTAVSAEVSASLGASSATTETHAVLGTPAYMSPEQFLGEPVSPASDQFSFCVALYEALYGQRPFQGSTTIQLVEAIVEQRIEPAPSGSSVPQHVFRALAKGLAREPGARHDSMRALLDALDGRRRRPLLWIAVGATAIAAVGFVLSSAPATESRRCEAAASIREVWDAPTREALADGSVDETALAALGTYADGLEEDALLACSSAPPSSATAACQVRLVARFDEVVGLMSSTLEPGGTQTSLVEQLPDRSTCQHSHPVPRTADPEALVSIARLAQKARGLSETPDKALAEATAQRAVEMAHLYGDTSSQLDAMRARAMVRIRNHQFDLGLEDLRAAHSLALASGDDGPAAQIANSMVWVLLQQRKLDEAERWARTAQAAADRLDDDGAVRGYVLHRLGLVAMHRGDAKDALELMRRALEFWRAAEDPREIGSVLSDLQQVAADLGDMQGSLAYAKEAVETYREAFGQNDPQLGTAHHNLGNAQQNLGNNEAALAAYLRGYEIRAVSYGPTHPQTGISAYAVATALFDVERMDEVVEWIDKSRAALPEAHPALSAADMLEAQVAENSGDIERALTLMNRALVEMVSLVGADHPHVGELRVNKATLLRSAGDLDESLTEAGLAVDALGERFGSEHPLVGRALSSRGETLLALKRWDDAARDLRKALAIQTAAAGGNADAIDTLRALVSKAERGGR